MTLDRPARYAAGTLDLILALTGLGAVIAALDLSNKPQTSDLPSLADWAASFGPIVLLPLSALFLVAAVGHWRSYPWRWLVQWIAVVCAVVVAGMTFVLSR